MVYIVLEYNLCIHAFHTFHTSRHTQMHSQQSNSDIHMLYEAWLLGVCSRDQWTVFRLIHTEGNIQAPKQVPHTMQRHGQFNFLSFLLVCQLVIGLHWSGRWLASLDRVEVFEYS